MIGLYWVYVCDGQTRLLNVFGQIAMYWAI